MLNGCNDIGGWLDAAWECLGAADSRIDHFTSTCGKGSTITGHEDASGEDW